MYPFQNNIEKKSHGFQYLWFLKFEVINEHVFKALRWSHQVVRDFISVHETRNGFKIRRAGICRAQRVRLANLFPTSYFTDRSAYNIFYRTPDSTIVAILLFLFPLFFFFSMACFVWSCQEVGIFSTWMLGRFQRNKKSVTRCLFFSMTNSIEWRDGKLHMLIWSRGTSERDRHVLLSQYWVASINIASSLPWESV